MARLEERIYDLALDSLGEQERSVNEIRSSGSTLLAATVVVASFFVRTSFVGGVFFGSGVAGAAGALSAAVLLLRPHGLASRLRPIPTYRTMWARGLRDQPFVDAALIELLDRRLTADEAIVIRLERVLTLGLAALAVETVGFGIAAAVGS